MYTTVQNRTKVCLSIRADYFCVHIVHYSDTFHINVCLHIPIKMNNKDTVQ